jgi:uncharacterized membrane protein YedE/YeeE
METLYPLYSTGTISSNQNLFYALFIGIAFGFILERGGFANSKHIASVFYFRNLRVSHTMVATILTTSTWMIIAIYLGWVDFNKVFIPSTYLMPYVVGGALFGIGMVMSGWCPGTAVAGIATGKVDAAVFGLGLLAGMLFYFGIYDYIADFANSTYAGRYTLDKLLGGDVYTSYFATVVLCLGLMMFMIYMKRVRDKKEGDY